MNVKSNMNGSCLQMHIRFGARFLWTITDFTKFHEEQYLESRPLYFQNGCYRKGFNLEIIKAKSNSCNMPNPESYFLHFNFQEKFLEDSQYHIRYCVCDKFGQQVTKLETVELQIIHGRVGPIYINFLQPKEFLDKIEQHGTLVIDVFMLDVSFPTLYCDQALCVEYPNRVIKSYGYSNHQNFRNFDQLYKQDVTSSDVILLVKGQKLFAHRIVLITKSPTFSLLLLPMLSKKQKLCITVDDFDPAVVAKMLKYMYLNKVNGIKDLVYDLYHIAKRYELEDLADLCVGYMSNEINVENAMSIYFFASKNNIDVLIKIAKQFIKLNFDHVMESGLFKRIIDSYDTQEHGL